MPTATCRIVAAGAAGVVLVSKEPLRTSFIVQNVDVTNAISVYTKPGKELEGLIVQAQTWVQFEKEDDCDKKWYVVAVAGTPTLHVLEFFTEKEKKKGFWW